MKKILFFLATTICCVFTSAQSIIYKELCYHVDGFWSDWKTDNDQSLIVENDWLMGYDKKCHPSEYMWKITKSTTTPKSKDGEWECYDGTFEYYITDEYPEIKSILLSRKWINPHNHNVSRGETPCVKKIVPATIKVLPKRDGRYGWQIIWNVFFEGGAFGVCFEIKNENYLQTLGGQISLTRLGDEINRHLPRYMNFYNKRDKRYRLGPGFPTAIQDIYNHMLKGDIEYYDGIQVSTKAGYSIPDTDNYRKANWFFSQLIATMSIDKKNPPTQ